MQRIFHVPSHLDYAGKLTAESFAPVTPPGGAPLRVSDLLVLRSWDFFDVLHLHTVELAVGSDLSALAARLRATGKGFVFTLHDLTPNIESDTAAFEEKTRLAVHEAPRVVTLTQAAARQVSARFGVRPSVIPHGYAAPPGLSDHPGGQSHGLFSFGALRPNRDLLGLVHAWQQLPAARPPLRILLRSLGTPDRQRYADELAQVAEITQAEADLTVETTADMVTHDELTKRCQAASALVMPYRRITHSGQLELARDIGVAAVLPDTPTVHAQLSETGYEHPCVWFAPDALRDPSEFAGYLERASKLVKDERRSDFLRYRSKEHENILAKYQVEYSFSGG